MTTKLPKAPRLFIFDMDGVLFDSTHAHAAAFRKALGPKVRQFDYRQVAGMKTRDAMLHVLRANRLSYSPRQLQALIRTKQRLAYQLLQQRPPIVSGCRALLTTLRKHSQLALVSSSRRKNVRLFLKSSKTRPLFSTIVAGEDMTRSKPSPVTYQQVLRKLRVKPSEGVVIEDAIQGIQAARRAGIAAIGVLGHSSRAQLKRAGAFKIIRRIQELRSYAAHR